MTGVQTCALPIFQEGEKPSEDPKELLAEFDGCIARLEELAARINLVNCRTVVEGKSLTELLARRDSLTLKLRTYQNFLSEASQQTYRAMRTEIRILSTVDVRRTQKTVDALAKELRELDNRIQAVNWTTEL